MPNVNHNQIEMRISDEAFGLLNCFADGIDEAVRRLAEQIAQNSQPPGKGAVVVIEKAHVQKAGQTVLNALREYLKQNPIGIDQEQTFESMVECINEQTCRD